MHSTQRTCPWCHKPVRVAARFCSQCGSPLTGVDSDHDLTVSPAAVQDAPRAFAVGAPSPSTSHTQDRGLTETLDDQGRYRLGRLLGKGGFGEAYLAHDLRLDRPCVVKRLALTQTSGDETLIRANFAREARLLVSLNTPGHPHIPEIYEYIPERHALVMKYIAGHSLAHVLDRRSDPLAEEEALRYARAICSALVYMHERTPEPVLHRDIKPANIMLGDDGRVWLIDFGLAKATLGQHSTFDSETTQLAGTLGYSPPEQWLGATEPRSDVYALAATMYMLLTNYQPPRAQLRAQLYGDYPILPKIRELNAAVRPHVEQLIERGMILEVAQRPTAAEFLAALDAILNQPNIPTPPAPTAPPEVTAFVGRADALHTYLGRLQSEHLAVITGPPGVGKTAVAAMLARQIGDPAHTFWHAFHEHEGIDGLIWDLAAFLAWNGHVDVWHLLQSARVTGGQPPPPETLIDYLVKVLHDQAYVLCLDDFHAVADEPLLEQLLRRLLADPHAGSVAVIITSRTLPAFTRTAVAPLAGMTTEGTRTLLENQHMTLPIELVQRLTTATNGNVQLLLLAIDALRRAHDPARVIANLAEVADIERYLLHEVDRGLNGDERTLMEALAVLLGYPAPPDAIETVLNADRSVRRMLGRLQTRNLLIMSETDDGRTYVQHSIIQRFYYESIGRRSRAAMHQRAAAYYERDAADPLQAARHAQLAGDWSHAADLATSDIWEMVNRGQARALQAVLEHFSVQQLDDARWVEVLLTRGEIDTFLGNQQSARENYQAALDRIATLPTGAATREQFAKGCYGMGALLEYEAPQAARVWLEQGLAHAANISDRMAAALYIKIGTVYIPLGNYSAAQAALGHAEELLPDGPSQLRISALHTLGTLYSTQGAITRGMEYTQQGLAICAQLNDYVRMAKMLSNLAIDKLISADLPGALADFQQALELADRIGNAQLRLIVDLNVGIAYIRMGDDQAALRHIQEGVTLAHAAHMRVFEITGRASLADIYIRQDALDLATTELDEAERLALEIDAKAQLPEIYRNYARVQLAQGHLERAQHAIDQSLDGARAMGLDMDEGLGQRVYGQVLLARSQFPAAMDAFERSLALLEGNDEYEAAVTRSVRDAALHTNVERIDGY